MWTVTLTQLTYWHGSYKPYSVLSWWSFVPNNQIPPCMMKLWVRHDSGTHEGTNENTYKHTHMDRGNYICPSTFLNLFCAHHLIILYICAKCCQSISKGIRLRVTNLNSRVDARVVTNVDERTYRHRNQWKTRSLYHTMPEACVTIKL